MSSAGFGFSQPEEDLTASTAEAAPTTRAAALTEPDLVVTVENIAGRFGLDPLALTAAQRQRIVDAIIDAQAAVEGELGRTLIPVERSFPGVTPYFNAAGGTLDRETWPMLTQFYDVVEVTSAVANPDGTFDLVVQIGLDGRTVEPIRSYIRAHAIESLRLDPSSGMGQLAVTSVSAEGQSISYEKRSTTEGAAGALPTLQSLRRWKRLAAYQAPTRLGLPWPYRSGLR